MMEMNNLWNVQLNSIVTDDVSKANVTRLQSMVFGFLHDVKCESTTSYWGIVWAEDIICSFAMWNYPFIVKN
jgi:hypothetical protein